MPDKKLIRKYIDGDCTPEEEKIVKDYLSGNRPDLSLLEEVLDESWTKSIDGQVDEKETLSILFKLRQKIEGAKLVSINRAQWYNRAGVAAAAVILLFTGLLVFQPGRHREKQSIAAVSEQWATVSNAGSKVSYTLLPDSSKVWLAPNASFSYAVAGNRAQREIRLTGEAFFEIQHDAARPFVVYAGELTTRVLGTAFNIEAYQKEKTVRVSLAKGKVAVWKGPGGGAPMDILQPGEMLNYDKTGGTAVKENIRLKDLQEWTRGAIVLTDIPLNDAINRIAGRYRISVHYGKDIESKLAGKRITTVFRDESPDQMLNTIMFLSDCCIVHKKGEVLEITDSH